MATDWLRQAGATLLRCVLVGLVLTVFGLALALVNVGTSAARAAPTQAAYNPASARQAVYGYDSPGQPSTLTHGGLITAALTRRDSPLPATASRALSRSALAAGVAAEEVGTVAPRSLDALSQQGAQLDRNGLTQAGRSLQKHANRPGNTVYPKVPGGELNSAGQNVLDDILTNPLTAERSNVHPSFGPVREFLLPDMGARFEEFGRLIGFL
jgi:hypothetical protein